MSVEKTTEPVSVCAIVVPEGRHVLPNFERDVENLMESMERIGLLTPINVTQDMVLVAGLRRLEAAKRLGWKEVDAAIRDYDEVTAELAEIDENLIRGELDHLTRVTLRARKEELYSALHPDTKGKRAGALQGAKARWKMPSDTVSPGTPFAKREAEKTGLSRRTIERDVALGRALDKDAASDLAGTKVANSPSQLKSLARLPAEEQRKVAAEIKHGNRPCVPVPPKNGRESVKTHREFDSLIGKLIRELDELGCYESCRPHVDAILAIVNEDE